MAVSFEELEGSPTIRVDAGGTTAQRVFRVAWDDWRAFAGELLGSFRRVGCGFTFEPPLPFPELPNVVVADLAIEPLDPGNPDGADVATITSGTNKYTIAGAKVTASYRSLDDPNHPARADLPEVPDGTFLTYEAELGAEWLTLPGRLFHWDDPPDDPALPPDINPGVMIPTGSFQLTWRRVAMPDWNAIRDLRGKVNDGPFLGSPPGTVLFLGARVSREFQFAEGSGFWRVRYAFSERAIELAGGGKVGWNHQFKEEAVGGEHWVEIKDDSENPPYEEADLTQLFVFTSC